MSKVAKAVGAVVAFAAAVFATIITGGAAGAFIAFAIKAGNALLVLSALDFAAEAFADTPRARSTGQDIEYSGTVEPGRIIYGRQKVSGMNVIPPWTSGTKNKFLHQVLALAAHECNDVDSVFFGQTEITSIGPITG